MAADDVLELKREWYQRYPHYPDYCSTPEQMDQRAIPPLFGGQDAPSAVGDTKLVHVTAILRHGARTILDGPTGTTADGTSTATSNYQCWDGYWTSPETGIWDCGLKTLSMPPNPERIVEEEEGDTDPELQKIDQEMIPEAMLLFTKQYDALKAPQSNVLNGTCEQGQLILQGYEQQVKNGQALRDAYLYQEGKYSSTDSRMHLFQVGGGGRGGSNVLEPWADETQLYLRSDDAQATMTSGQLLMRGLFEAELIRSRNDKIQSVDSALNAKAFPTIPVHTADYSRDILGGFREHCKALGLLQAASDSSWEYQQFLRSDEAQEVQEFLGWHYVHDEQSILDCLMTTVCTDRPLPDRFGIYNPHPHSWFNRIAKYHVQNHSFHLNYNDAGEYRSKKHFELSSHSCLVMTDCDVRLRTHTCARFRCEYINTQPFLSEYSKLSMGPLWAEIMDHIAPVLGDIMETQDRPRPPAKLAIYSGYDSTIMEILASLGAWKAEAWPPYASMVLLEVSHNPTVEWKTGSFCPRVADTIASLSLDAFVVLLLL